MIHPQEEFQHVKSPSKFAYIDILRGAAILGVVAVHSSQHIKNLNILVAWIFNFGQLGVQLFFVASALTLCLSSAQRHERSPGNFYVRRFFRIAPLFYLAIPFYFIWRVCTHYYSLGVMGIPENYSIRGVVETVFFVHGFDPRNFNFVVPGGWSIAAEMSFYAIFPLLYVLQSKYQKLKFVAFAAAIFLICLLANNFLIYSVQPILIEKGFIQKFVLQYDFLSSSILNQINIFLIGIICYQYTCNGSYAVKYRNQLVILALPLLVLSCYLLNSKSYIHTPFTGLLYPVLAATAFGLISIKLSTVQTFPAFFSQYLIRIGQVSFSMYILHFFVLDIFAFIIEKVLYNFIAIPELRLLILYATALIVTFSLSKLTYKHIEKPGINAGNNLIVKLDKKRQQTPRPTQQKRVG